MLLQMNYERGLYEFVTKRQRTAAPFEKKGSQHSDEFIYVHYDCYTLQAKTTSLCAYL